MSQRVIYRYRHVGGILHQVSASTRLAPTPNRLFSHITLASRRLDVKETALRRETWTWREKQAKGGRARIDHPPGVMDSAISGSGQRRREGSDLCFSDE